MWDSEMVILLRHIIDDVDEPVKYSDDRLMQLLLISAQYTQNENAFAQTYTISVENTTIKPDPTNARLGTRDEPFINLTILKAACLLASSGLLKLSKENLSVKTGPYQFDGRGKLAGRKIAAQTWCDAYKEAQWEHVTQHGEPGRAIIGPYRTAAYNRGYYPRYWR
jgi:hypothetical protein